MLNASFEQPVDEPTEPTTVASHQHIQVTQQRKRCNTPAADCGIFLENQSDNLFQTRGDRFGQVSRSPFVFVAV
ncbi:MAG: hypothetical protein DCF22_22690 [Leptolyngbya sp.]|nr:MAG: hypothetical protein DCF22_22690 [Leptolyngbya sp.]